MNSDACKEDLSITVSKNKNAKHRLGLLNYQKNRGVQHILILCADGLSKIKKAVAAAYLNTEHQHCIAHKVRKTLIYNLKRYTLIEITALSYGCWCAILRVI